jgi:Asp-tRNA(Asn)/Glu-tRNA(Gln) amidotransferase A subunit family amidase
VTEAPDAIAAVERALEVVDEWEPTVHAFVHLDPDRARAEARTLAARGGPLAGLALGVKDIFDTADQPTEYGSPIYAGHRPRADAAAVALLRAAGATALGKTVTTELAVFHPGPTGNPHRVTHTPGGSSSGSAAAVACGMVDVALGTQTAGSVIRPASYCGVLGFKPTFGSVATAGVKPVAPSLDTVGWFAREVALLDRVRVALTGRRPALLPRDTAPYLALVRTARWDDASDDGRVAVEEAARLASAVGATVVDRALPEPFDLLAADQPVVMACELARSFAWEWHHHRDRLSRSLQDLIERGLATDPDAHDDVRARAALARAAVDDEVFGDADALLTLSATGEAPEGLTSTGDPRFARLWTLLGLPTVSVPGLTGATGLPVGVQLVGRAGRDASLLATAEWLARVLPTAPAPTL